MKKTGTPEPSIADLATTGAIDASLVNFNPDAAPVRDVELSRRFIRPCEGMLSHVWWLPLARSLDVKEFYAESSLNPSAPLFMWAGILLSNVAEGAGIFQDAKPVAARVGAIVYMFEPAVLASQLATCKARSFPIGVMANRKERRTSRKEKGKAFDMWVWHARMSPEPQAMPALVYDMFALPQPGGESRGALPPASDVLDTVGEEVTG